MTMPQAASLDRHGSEWRRAVLARTALFRGCATAQLNELAQVAHIGSFFAGQIIAHQGEPADTFYVVVSGRVRTTIGNDDGRELIIAELRRDDFFGEAALVGEALHPASAVAVGDVQVVALLRSALLAHLRTHPAAALLLAVELARSTASAQQRLGELALQPVEARVVGALERLARKHGEHTDAGLVLHDRPTHQQLASWVGITRETLTRTLGALCRRGLVVTRGNWLRLSTAVLDGKAAASSPQP